MLEVVTILTPPADTPTTAGEQAIADAAKRYLEEATAEATKAPDAGTPACPPLDVPITLSGEAVRISIVPAALPDLFLHRYCTAGWKSAMTFGGEVLAHVNGFVPPGGLAGAAPSKPRGDPVLLACQLAAVRHLVRGAELLELLVAQTILRVAHEVIDAGTRRVTDLHKRLNGELDRYGFEPIPPPDTGAGAAQGGSGQDPPDQGLTPLDPKAAPDLYKAVREVTAAYDRMSVARSRAAPVTNEGSPGPSPWQEGSGGTGGSGGSGSAAGSGDSGGTGSGSGKSPASGGTRGGSARDEEALKAAAKKAEASYAELLGTIVRDRGHPIAPAVVELLVRSRGSGGEPPEDSVIQPVALKYLRDTIALTGNALPKAYPFPSLAAKVAPQGGAQLRATRPDPAEVSMQPELRAAFWAMATRDYVYEPLDDETLLLEQLDRYQYELTHAENEGDALAAAMKFQSLRGMIEARDEVEKARRDARSRETAGLERLGEAAAMLDLIGLIFPPVELVGLALGGIYFAGNALLLMEHLPGDVAQATRAAQAGTTSALIASDYATSARLLATRPTVADLIARFAVEMAAISALSKMSRVAALSIRITFDLEALVAAQDAPPAKR